MEIFILTEVGMNKCVSELINTLGGWPIDAENFAWNRANREVTLKCEITMVWLAMKQTLLSLCVCATDDDLLLLCVNRLAILVDVTE